MKVLFLVRIALQNSKATTIEQRLFSKAVDLPISLYEALDTNWSTGKIILPGGTRFEPITTTFCSENNDIDINLSGGEPIGQLELDDVVLEHPQYNRARFLKIVAAFFDAEWNVNDSADDIEVEEDE